MIRERLAGEFRYFCWTVDVKNLEIWEQTLDNLCFGAISVVQSQNSNLRSVQGTSSEIPRYVTDAQALRVVF